MLNKQLLNNLNVNEKRIKRQTPIGICLLIVLIVIGIYLSTISLNLSIYFFTGIAFGFVLQKSRFCFTAAMRDPSLTGATALTKAVLVAVALTTTGFTIVKYISYIKGDEIPGQYYIEPITLGTIVGGFIFGIGMVIASGCASGILMRIGEGFQVHLITLISFLFGSLLGAKDFLWWNNLLVISKKGIFLPETLGWLPAFLLQILAIALLYVLADKWEKRDN